MNSSVMGESNLRRRKCVRPGASDLFTNLLVAVTSPSMSGRSLEFVAPNGKFRRLEPVVDNAGASADSDALRHVSDGIRAQRAEAMGVIALHCSGEHRGPYQYWLKCSSGPPGACLAFAARARVAGFARPTWRRRR